MAIPKSSSWVHLVENLAIFEFELTDAEMERTHDLTDGLKRRI